MANRPRKTSPLRQQGQRRWTMAPKAPRLGLPAGPPGNLRDGIGICSMRWPAFRLHYDAGATSQGGSPRISRHIHW